ncbi:MAG: nucleoside phosphorylase [Bacteroidetes bacterium]|nr:nucleoside phosphorylase [Bacteroidota bacterium]
MKKIAESELILNSDKSIYHLKLQPHQIATDIIVVGDPNRVKLISDKFSSIEHVVENREFITHTGYFNNKRISVIGTGIGTDNIDIVLNELDALVNIDLDEKVVKNKLTSLNIVRIGTCGALQEHINVNDFVVSEYALGLDGLMNFYEMDYTPKEQTILKEFYTQTNYSKQLTQPYIVKGSSRLHQLFAADCHSGITATACGFFGPQGRELRLKLKEPQLNDKLHQFGFEDLKINNFEMETSAIYGLSRLMGHQACTVCVVVANRYNKSFTKDYHPAMEQLVDLVLQKLTQ